MTAIGKLLGDSNHMTLRTSAPSHQQPSGRQGISSSASVRGGVGGQGIVVEGLPSPNRKRNYDALIHADPHDYWRSFPAPRTTIFVTTCYRMSL